MIVLRAERREVRPGREFLLFDLRDGPVEVASGAMPVTADGLPDRWRACFASLVEEAFDVRVTSE